MIQDNRRHRANSHRMWPNSWGLSLTFKTLLLQITLLVIINKCQVTFRVYTHTAFKLWFWTLFLYSLPKLSHWWCYVLCHSEVVKIGPLIKLHTCLCRKDIQDVLYKAFKKIYTRSNFSFAFKPSATFSHEEKTFCTPTISLFLLFLHVNCARILFYEFIFTYKNGIVDIFIWLSLLITIISGLKYNSTLICGLVWIVIIRLHRTVELFA